MKKGILLAACVASLFLAYGCNEAPEDFAWDANMGRKCSDIEFSDALVDLDFVTKGICIEANHYYCDAQGALSQEKCTKECAYNDKSARYACVGEQPPKPKVPTAGEKCAVSGVTNEGLCNGEMLYYCENDVVVAVNCTSEHATCGWDNTEKYFGCLSLDPKAGDDCSKFGVTETGFCSGDNVLYYCEAGKIETMDCNGSGNDAKICGWHVDNRNFDCLALKDNPVKAGDSCEAAKVTETGFCDANVVFYCDNSKVSVMDCTKDGKTCAWNAENAFFDCMSFTQNQENYKTCDNIDNVGICENNVIFYCDNGQLMKDDCNNLSGNECKIDPVYKYYVCLPK